MEKVGHLFQMALVTLLLLFPIQPFLADELDREKLRMLARLPRLTIQVGLAQSQKGMKAALKTSHASEIESLEKALKTDASIADSWQRLGLLYSRLDEDEKAKEAALKAAELYRKNLKLGTATGRLMAELGTALWRAGQIEEAEKTIRRAVEENPQDWHCWMALGNFQGTRPITALFEGFQDKISKESEPEKILSAFAQETDAGEKIARAKKAIEEATAALDKAVKLAPDEFETREARGWFLSMYRPSLQWVLAALEQKDEHGQKDLQQEWGKNFFNPEAKADLEAAARLRPDSFFNTWWALIALIKTLTSNCTWESLPEDARKSLREGMERLKIFSRSDDKTLAASALEFLALLHLMLQELDLAKNFIRQTLVLDNDREEAWEGFFLILISKKQYDELAKALMERLKHADSARHRFLLAKAYEKSDQLAKASDEIQKALKLEPESFHANLGFASILMRQGSVVSSTDYLTKAYATYEKAPTKEMWVDYCLNASVYYGLVYKVEEAKNICNRILGVDPNNQDAKDVMLILAAAGS